MESVGLVDHFAQGRVLGRVDGSLVRHRAIEYGFGEGIVFLDQRQVLGGGEIVRIDADTDGDRKPDVIQTYREGALVQQDEDSDADGVVDLRFRGNESVPVPEGTDVAGADFGRLGCGSFSGFWWKR